MIFVRYRIPIHEQKQLYHTYIADSNNSMFTVRPQKEFSPVKGRARLIGLKFLCELVPDDLESNSESSKRASVSEQSNAYGFMARAHNVNPSISRWNASIRVGNYVSFDTSPLCVSISATFYLSPIEHVDFV